MEEEYIVFAEPIGKISGNSYIYRFLFSDNPETIWGDNFNVTPAAGIPGIQPLPQGITKEWRVVSEKKLGTAVKSSWFSMQDCLDGIISLVYGEDENTDIVINFGKNAYDVKEILKNNGIFFQEMEFISEDNNEKEEDFEDELGF